MTNVSENIEPAERDEDIGETTDEMVISNAFKILEKFGRFQIRTLLLLCPTYLALGTIIVAPVFLNLVPDFRCQTLEPNNSYSNETTPNFINNGLQYGNNNITLDQCKRYTATYQQTNSTPQIVATEDCDKWDYNTINGNTVASEFDLICNSAWKRPLTISFMMIGMAVGGVSGGKLSDRFGRRTISLISKLTTIVLTLVGSFSFDYWFYNSVLFAIGICYVFVYNSVFTWTLEIVYSGNKRTLAAFIINGCYVLGGMLMSLIAYFVPDWNWLLRVLVLIELFGLPLMWMVPESPMWLLGSEKTDRSVRTLKNIANTNGTNISELSIQNLKDDTPCKEENEEEEEEEEVEEEKENGNIGLLCRNVVLRRRIILICILWNVSYMSYFTMVYNASNLGGSSHINNLVGCALDLVAAFSVTGLMKKLGRRNTLVIVMTAIGCVCLISPFAKEGNNIIGIVTAMIGRLFTTSAMMMMVLYTGEIFPTMLRNTSVGLASMSSRLGSILAPFLVFAGEVINLSIPFYVLSGLAFISVYVSLLLPQTFKSHLPSLLADALALKDPRFLPNCSISKKKKKAHNHENVKEADVAAINIV